MFERILIATRSEAAARVARTCKRIGATAIAVVVHEGETGVHVDACDEVFVVASAEGGAIHVDDIAKAAVAAKADAVHPGFGTTSQHLALARALESLASEEPRPKLVGSSADAMARCLDRTALRASADETFVRYVPGPAGAPPALADVIEEANAIGYPVFLRADRDDVSVAAVRVDDDDELMNEWDGVRDEATRHEALPTIERCIERARTLSVLVASDAHGEVIAIAEVETTLREHGDVPIAESPSPELIARGDGEAIRTSIFESAIRAVTPLALVGFSTVEFLVDGDALVFISAIHAGLPRHSAAIEMLTGVDLVGVELTLAAGLPMPDEVHSIQPTGHAFFATVVAADDASAREIVVEFRPPPAPQRQVRFEPSVLDGSKPAPGDGRILTGVGTYAPIRHQALLALDRTLAELEIAPLRTNAKWLRAILADEAYRAGQYDTASLGRIRPVA